MSALTGRFWFDLSENELAKYNFAIDDPTVWPDIVESLPDGVRLIAIVHKYVHKSNKLKCIHCERTLHNEGAIVLLSNGRFARIGSTCGPRLFPDQWKDADNKFERARAVAENRRRVDELLERIPLAQQELRKLRQPFRIADRVLGNIAQVMGSVDLSKLRTEAARHEGMLRKEIVINKEISELFREAQGRQSLSRDDDETQNRTVERIVIHRLKGEAFLNQSFGETLSVCLAELESAQRSLRDTKIPQQKRGIQICVGVKKKLEHLVAGYAAMFYFFEPDNLKMISEWLDGRKTQKWISKGQHLLLLDSYGGTKSIASIDSAEIPPALAVDGIVARTLL